MSCPACAHENPPRAKFCLECGAALAARCPSCTTELPPAAKFCLECGTDVRGTSVRKTTARTDPRPAPRSDARKIVTIVFADLVGSTALHERLDAESARRLMERYYEALRAAVDAHGGTVVKLLGDGVMAAFGLRQVAEDDALRAVRAAVAMQEAYRALAVATPLAGTGLRVGVNTGEVVVSGGEDDLIGDPVNVAARLQEVGRDGDVVVGEATRRLVSARVTLATLGSVALKGRAEAVAAYRVESLEPPAGAAATPFVGRDDELRRLAAVYQAAVSTPSARLAVLLGSPGLGKSRLIDELARRSGDAATVLAAHCDAAGGATFAPLASALRVHLGIEDAASPDAARAAIDAALASDDADRARIATGIAALVAGTPALPEETFFVVRRFLGAMARARPVVLVIDDLHWAEPLLLDLVEHLVQWAGDVPLFVLVGARPELRDLRSSLVTPGGLVADVVALGGLDAGASMRLAASVVGATDLPAAVAARVLATSEGNPLFVGELVRMLVDERAIERQGDRWIVGANLAALEMPPTIHALLAARIERLDPEERTVLEHASVVGRHFSRSAVAALLGSSGSALDARLEALRRTELIEPDTGWFLGEPVLRFHHVLIRDAAYRRLLKGRRAALHAQLADWIEAKAGDNPEHDETIGRHLERAHQLLHDLGPLDHTGRSLGARAAARLSAAGRRALAGDDVPLAANLLGRAIERLDSADSARAELALDWSEALLSAGDVGLAKKAVAELTRFVTAPDATSTSADDATARRRLSAWRTCFTGQLIVLTQPQHLQAAADSVSAAARELAALGDSAGEAKAHFVDALALARLGEVGGCEAALDRALAAARAAGDRRRANTVLAIAPIAALWGPSPVTRASGRCLDVVRVLRITQGAPAVEAVALSCQGVLEALRGRTEAARRMISSARKMVEELGITQRLLEVDVSAGLVELLDGDALGAERNLRGAYEGLRDLGHGIDAARASALLARALLAQGRHAEAEALSHESELLAGGDLKAAIAWRGVRAEALASRGEHATAVELATNAVELAAATDALLDHADARTALAAALRAAGRADEADAEARRATELWEAKGATLLAERARRDLDRVAPAVAAAVATAATSRAVRRRVRPNAATAAESRFAAAFAAGDRDALAAIVHDDYHELDHSNGSEWKGDAALASIERLLRSRDPRYDIEDVATLGERLTLFRRRTHSSGDTRGRWDVGPYEHEAIQIGEVAADGRLRSHEVFAADRLGAAIARLYERQAELVPEGRERARAAGIARSVRAYDGPVDPDHLSTVLAASYRLVDHRALGTWSARTAEEHVAHWRLQRELAPDFAHRFEDVLACDAQAIVARVSAFGTARESGGHFENRVCALLRFGADGRVTGVDVFEAEHEAEALAGFDALAAGGAEGEEPPAHLSPWSGRFVLRASKTNAASAALDRWQAAYDTASRSGDWGAARALCGADFVFDDRRRLARLSGDRELFIAANRERAAIGARPQRRPICIAGDRVAIEAFLWSGGPSGGRFEIEYLDVVEVDESRLLRAIVLFDVEDAREAWREALARWGAIDPDLAPTLSLLSDLTDAFDAHDPARLRALCAADVAVEDHRRAGMGRVEGGDVHVDSIAVLGDSAVSMRVELGWSIPAIGPHGALATIRHTGDVCRGATGGDALILLLHAGGRVTHVEIFEPDREATALARFDELAGPVAASQRFANVATRFNERFVQSWAARDWNAIAALHGPIEQFEDHRRLMQMQALGTAAMAHLRMLFDVPHSRWAITPIATRGDCLALSRVVFEGDVEESGGPLVIDYLAIDEVDRNGRSRAVVLFDPDDLDAAYEALDARFGAGESTEHARVWTADRRLHASIAGRDWDALAASLAPDFRMHDHRVLGWGSTLDDVTTFVRSQRALFELSPDYGYRHEHVRLSPHAGLYRVVESGTREGGAFENRFFVVGEIDADSRYCRFDLYDLDQGDSAWARFDEMGVTAGIDLSAAVANPDVARLDALDDHRGDAPTARLVGARRDPLRIPPNAVTRAWDRWCAAAAASDYDALAAMYDPAYRLEDRRLLFRMTVDLGGTLSSDRILIEGGWRPARTLLATAGDRLALQHILWTTGDAGVTSEVETLMVSEVGPDGRFVCGAAFDPGDRAGAAAELQDRYTRSTRPAELRQLTKLRAARDAGGDLVCLRAALPDDFFFRDHRRTGLGRIEGADAYIAALAALWELAPDAMVGQPLYFLVDEPHASLSIGHSFGTLAGGGRYESIYAMIVVHGPEAMVGAELFEVDDLDAATARFEELRPANSG